MGAQAKITSKNQITLPREVRDGLHVGVGDLVEFEADEHGFRVRARAASSPFARYRGAARRGSGRSLDDVQREVDRLRGHDPVDAAMLGDATDDV